MNKIINAISNVINTDEWLITGSTCPSYEFTINNIYGHSCGGTSFNVENVKIYETYKLNKYRYIKI